MLGIDLIAVIGPIEPALFTAWISHYKNLGIDTARFHLGFHFPPHTPDADIDALLDTSRDQGIRPAVLSLSPWHEHTNTQLRDALRAKAFGPWHLLADADEFQTYPNGINEVLANATENNVTAVGGLLLDRVAADGTLADWDPVLGLDDVYPLGGFFTHHVLQGDPRKIVLARTDIPVSSGNHRAPHHHPANEPPICVHHFKWRHRFAAELPIRAEAFASGTWQTQSTALASEYQRLTAHLSDHDGRIDTSTPDAVFRPVSLATTPTWWAGEATHLHRTWRPPDATQNESAATSSSPSPEGTSNRA